MLFEFINKVPFPLLYKCTVTYIPDLFLIESQSKFGLTNLAVLILEHLYKVFHIKDCKNILYMEFKGLSRKFSL